MRAAADAVNAKIEAIGEVTLDDEAAIAEARAAYNALTDDQKALVDETKIAAAEKTLEALKKAEADKAAADKVNAMIDAIGEVTLESKDALKAASDAYALCREIPAALMARSSLFSPSCPSVIMDARRVARGRESGSIVALPHARNSRITLMLNPLPTSSSM